MVALGAVAVISIQADQVDMKNGDHYVGKVLSVNTNTVVFQNDVLGTVNLAREKVVGISLATASPSNATITVQAATPVRASTNAAVSPVIRPSATTTNVMKQVEQEFLSGMGPEAKAKFNEMVKELMTGKLTVNDIRAQARTAADQLRSAKSELGSEAGDALDGYLAILENFLKDSGDSQPVPAPRPKSD